MASEGALGGGGGVSWVSLISHTVSAPTDLASGEEPHIQMGNREPESHRGNRSISVAETGVS